MADNKFTYTIDNSDIDSELTNFPTVIQLDNSSGKTSFDASAIFTELPNTDDWKKIKITDAFDNILYTEIEVWDVPNEKATLHVKVPTIDDGGNTVLLVDFNSTNADNSLRTITDASDDFNDADGDAPNSSLWWLDDISTGRFDIRSNKLEYYHVGGAGVEYGIYSSFFVVLGDFDIQVDFERPATYTDYIGVYFVITHNKNNMWADESAICGVHDFGSGLNYRSTTEVSGVPDTIYDGSPGTTGKLRITRVGSLLSILTWNGSTWDTRKTESSFSTEPMYPLLRAYANGSTDTILIFDNFVVNSADSITGFIGEIGEIPAQQVWDNNFVFVSHQAQDPSGIAPQILDSTSYSKNGTSHGTMLSEDLIDGVTGKMIDYDGTDDYITLGDWFDLSNSDFTLESRVKLNDLSSNSYTILGFGQGDANEPYWILMHRADKSGITWQSAEPGTGAVWPSGSAPITVDESSVALIRNAASGNLKIFIDGTVEINETLNPTFDPDHINGSLQIAAWSDAGGNYFSGAIGEVRISNIVRSDDWLEVTNLSLTDTLFTVAEWSASASITTVLLQPYDLERFVHLAVLSQLYDIQYVILQVLEQPYSEEFLAILSQTYGNMPTRTAVLTQYYTNLADVIAVLEQKYGNMSCVLAIIEQEYNLNADLLAILKQEYSLTFALQPAVLSQPYDLELMNKLLSVLSQPYSLFQGIDPIEHVVWVTINGVRVKVTKISYNYNIDNYCADFQITLALYDEWLMVEEFMAVVIHINETEHNVIVVNTNSQLSVQSSSYPIECKSQAILLDFPFATNIKDTFIVNGFASQVVNDLANLEGLSITWHMLSDPPLTATDVSVIGSSPLGAIRSIVNEIGGKINSHPDGSIHVVRRQPVDSDKYHLLTPAIGLTTGTDYITLNTNTDKRDGYNKFSVSNEDYHDGYDLVTDALDNGSYNALSYKVPWSSKQLQLHTSEITNVVIVDHNIITEPITKEIEIVEGKGKVSKPCYGGISYDYKDSLNLGSISIKEDGTVTTSISGHTIVTVTYDTRYWLWNVSNTDSESVQLLLVEI